MLFLIVQTVYWLALATWFGGVLFVAVAAPVINRTVQEYNPILPTVLSVNLDNQHGALLSGSIVANILTVLARIQVACAAALLFAITAQWLLIDLGDQRRLAFTLVRSALYVAAVILLAYDRRVVWPRIAKARDEYIAHADEPEVANPAKEQFDQYHREGITLLSLSVCVLLGLILFSGHIAQGVRYLP